MNLNLICFALIINLCFTQNQNIQFKSHPSNQNQIQIKQYFISVSDINNDYDIVNTLIQQKTDDKFKRTVPVDQFVSKNINYVEPEIIAPTIQTQQAVQKPQNKEQPINSDKNNVKQHFHNNLIIPKLNTQKKTPDFKIHQINNPSKIVHYSFQNNQKSNRIESPQKNQQPHKQEQNLVPIKQNPIQRQKKQQYSQQFIKNQVRIQILRRQRQKNLTIFRYVTFGLVLLALSTVLCLKKQKKKPVRYTPIDLQQQNFVV